MASSFITIPFVRLGFAGRNDANKFIFNVHMHYKQKPKIKVATQRAFPLLVVSRGIPVLDEWIKEHLCGLLKENAA